MRTRYLLDHKARWAIGLFGVVCIGAVAYEPITQPVQSGDVLADTLLRVAALILFFGLAWRSANTYVEFTNDSLLIRQLTTRRIPLDQIESVSIVLPKRWDHGEWDEYIAALPVIVHKWGKRQISARGPLLVLQLTGKQLAIEFDTDPTPVAQELRRRLGVFRSLHP